MAKTKVEARMRRKASIRKRMSGTADVPRLTVFRSLNHIYAQVVDDEGRKTLVSVSTLGKAKVDSYADMKKSEKAQKVGKQVAEACKERGIEHVVFDRNGYKYHGRVKALADGARAGGLKF